ncbi:MAG: hypothetical protein K8R67_05515, partial [Desulfobacteraceae bacterium]|nr:hypothetical protein [Desulfobacteraceae bacterium]
MKTEKESNFEINIMHVTLFLQSLLFLYLSIIGFIYSPIGQDASYYIVQARDIFNGLVLYKDLGTPYGPLVNYILCIPYLINKNPPYYLFYCIYYLTIIFSGFLIYKISAALFSSIHREIKLIFTLMYINLCLIQGGIYLNLEPFSVVFILGALFLFTKMENDKFLLLTVGILLSLSFLAKQYGGIFLLVFIGLILSTENDKYKFRKMCLLFMGFALPLLLTVTIHNIQQITVIQSIKALLGQNISVEGVKTGGHYTTIRFIVTIYRMYIYC